MKNHSRRHFLQSASALSLATVPLMANAKNSSATVAPLKGRLYKTLKFGMISGKGTLLEKFTMAKEAGFDGVELRATQINREETNKAIAETGLQVDGSVGFNQWKVKHTDPDPTVRAKALEDLLTGIRQTREVGGHSLLVVCGHGSDGPEEEIWKRSVDNISKAIPLAAELGVSLCIENVWNHFCYDHEGDTKQTAEKFVRYVDDFDSPWVGMQFDIGNHWKYGSMGEWIRTLGKRVIKLDVKGFSRKESKFMKIGEGDLDFTDVRKALTEIDYYGWCAAEVKGGGLERLKEVSTNMDRAFGL